MFHWNIKEGVRLDKIRSPMIFALLVAADTYYELFQPTITGGNEEGHDEEGPHPKGRGLDLRAKHLGEAWHRRWAQSISNRLGPKYRVLVEIFPDDPDNNHVHIDYIGE